MATHLRITAKRAGFYRAGIAHPTTPVDHPIDSFTPKEVTALKAEPMLVVQEIDRDPDPAEGGEKAPKK